MSSILIVDDQEGIRVLLYEVFKQEGIPAFMASNGFEALQIFEKEKVSCILMDLKMPGMDGIEISAKIRETDEIVPIFMMTAYDEQNLVDAAMKYKVKKFFTKPFNIFEVRDAVLAEIAADC